MKTAAMAVFGWLVPGGAYLWNRRYTQFAIAMTLVCVATIAGMALGGANLWPQAGQLQGTDNFTGILAYAGGVARILAGLPYMLGLAGHYSVNLAAGETREYGTVLLALAGIFNVLALADALESRKASHS